MYPLLFVNKRRYYTSSRLIWQKITLTGISEVKFTKALSKNTKSETCIKVLSLNLIGKINLESDVDISEVSKACLNLQQISFD